MHWLLAAGHTEDVPAESHPGATLPSSFTNQTGTVWTGHGGHSAARKKEASSWLADGFDPMRGAQVKPEDVKGVATANLRVRVPQCLSWPAIARWNRDGRTRPVGAMRAHL